ncbi:MAG: hypothetical protein ACFE95_17375, partial [Candidatus Hodarchaeota archaeon]
MKKKILFSLLLGAAILSMVITPVIAAQKVVVKEQEISPEVSALEPTDLFAPGVTDLLAQGASPVQIIIQTASHDYTQISNLIKSLGGTVSIEYQTINAIAATIPANALIDLTASPDLVKIYSDPLRYLQESVEPIERIAPTDALMGQDPEMIVNPIDIETMDAAPSTFVNPDLTNADQIWFDEDVFFGYGSSVAIIDTGCWHTEWTDPDGGIHRPWYWGNVYGGIDLSYDVGTAYEGYDNPMNHYHGTHCAALLAAHAEIVFGPGHLWADSMLYYYPDAGYYDDGTFIVNQSGTTYTIDLIESTQSAADFYDYWSASGHTPFMEDQISKIYLYHDTTSGELSLIMHHSIDNSLSGNMRVNFNFEGVPVGAYTALSDDPFHKWNETRPEGREFDLTLEPEGNWYHGANSDGGVISGLPTDESWSMTIHPDFIVGITDWQYQTLGDTDIDLIMNEPVTISYIPPRAHIFALGIAPLASIYAVKVFDHTGGGIPSSMVMQGIEAAMIEGVDVISMSLGGGCGAPGVDPTDLLVDAATEMG